MMTRRPGLKSSARLTKQGGVVGVIALIFIVIVALFAMTQAMVISASSLTDSARQSDSVEALFLAESAVERTGYAFINSGPTFTCNDASVGGAGTDYALGRGVFRVLGTFTTDFDGIALPAQKCRVRVQGEITASKVTRTVETIVGTNADLISLSTLNPNFNDVPYTGDRSTDETVDHPPSVWSLPVPGSWGSSIPYRRWDKSGGPDGSRTAFVRKTSSGNDTQTIGGAFTLTAGDVVITGPKVVRLTFDYQVWFGGNSNASNVMYISPYLTFATYPADVTLPEYGLAGGSGCASFAFCSPRTVNKPTGTKLNESAPFFALPVTDCGFIDTAGYESGAGGPNVGAGTCPAPPTGNTFWKTDGSLTFSITDTGSLSLKQLRFVLEAKSNGDATWIWLDNFRLEVPSVGDGGPSKMWREVAAP
jgi:hypothetical protein